MSLSDRQLTALTIAERANSVLSVIGTSIVISTFLSSNAFRKPINRVVFYASWANIVTNVGTLISRSAIVEGEGSTFCRFQAFIIQWSFPSDALWTFAMAFNVYLTFFHKYDASSLRKLEWKYALICYGLPFIPPFVYLFIPTGAKGSIYGSATLWCWVSVEWDYLRFAVFYGPLWLVILLTFAIYAYVGIDIARKRRHLQSFNNDAHLERLNKLYEIHASKVIHITSEAADDHNNGRDNSNSSSTTMQEQVAGKDEREIPLEHSPRNIEAANYPIYSVTVGRGEGMAEPASTTSEARSSNFQFSSTSRRRPPRVEVNPTNAAAVAYCKYAMLYFIALLVTWVPSTVNRVYSFVYPENANFALEFVSAFVLPLQGFWNSVIYVAVSWSTIVDIARRWRAQHPPKESSYKMNAVVRLKRFVTRGNTQRFHDAPGVGRPQHAATSGDTESMTQLARRCS